MNNCGYWNPFGAGKTGASHNEWFITPPDRFGSTDPRTVKPIQEPILRRYALADGHLRFGGFNIDRCD